MTVDRTYSYVVLIGNDGGEPRSDLDDAPTNVEVVSATSGWFRLDCATDGTTVCTIPTIYAGGSTFVEITTRAPEPGPFAATLTLGADGDDDPSGNTVELTGEAVEGP